MQKSLYLTLFILVAACNSVVVEKAKLQKVHNIALLSLFISERIPEVRGQGVIRKMDPEAKLQIAQDAVTAFHEALSQAGWGVISTEEVLAVPAYATFKKPKSQTGRVGKADNAFEDRYFLPQGFDAIWLETGAIPKRVGRPLVKNERDAVSEVLTKVQADTAAIFRIQFCFRTFVRDSQERARITAAASLQLLDKTGKVVHNLDRRDCGKDERGESRGSIGVAGEDWIYDPMQRENIRTLFRQAAEAEAARLMDSLPYSTRPPKPAEPLFN
ncbi:hypothetical protein K2X33_03930 [bacterium]|nr:hypothetical protein [bacterium]